MSRKDFFKSVVIVICFAMVFSMVIGCSQGNKTEGPTKEEVKSEVENNDSDKKEESVKDDSKKIEIKFADMHVPETIIWQAAEKWVEVMEEKVGDKVDIKLFPSAQLGGQRDLIEAVKLGTVQITYAGPPLLANLVPKFGVMDMPFMFEDYDHVERTVDGEVGEILNKALIEKEGLRMLAWYHIGFRDMITRDKQIKSLEDFKGVKFRSPESDAFIGMFKALGAVPTPIPWPEVYQVMKTKVVDGMETTPEGVTSTKVYEVAKYLTITGHINTVEGPIINEEFYKSLPQDVKNAMDESFEEVEKWQRELQIGANEKAYDVLKESGMEFLKIDKGPLVDACKSFWNEYSGKVEGSKELIDKIQEIR